MLENIGLFLKVLMMTSPSSEFYVKSINSAVWKLSGPDRVRYLNGQVTQDIVNLRPYETRWAAVCTNKGRMDGLIHVTATPDFLLIQAPGVLRESLGARLEKYLIADDALLEDVTDEWELIHMVSETGPEAGEGAVISKNPRYGIPGYDIYRERVEGASLETLFPHLPLATDEQLEELEIAHAVPKWGFELSHQTLPPEAGLEAQAISYKKGCYVGQEIISRLKSVGHVSKCLVLITVKSLEQGAVSVSRTKVIYGEKEIGETTRSIFSQKRGAILTLAYVAYDSAVAGLSVTVNGLQGIIEKSTRTIDS